MEKITFDSVPIGSIRKKTVKLQIGHFKNEYALYITKAPKAYDYDTSIFILVDVDRRYLLIPLERIEAQVTRYQSGNYMTSACDNEHVIKYACDKLICKLFAMEY